MPLASANRTQLRYKTEVTFGVTPGGNGTNLRATDTAGLSFALSSDTSKEVRSDRQVTDLILTGASASGSVPVELSYREYDALIEAALQGTWSTWGTNGVGAVIPTSATFAAGTLTAGAATSGSSIFTNLAAGQWVRISGSSVSGQNIIAQVSKTVAPTTTILTFEGTPFTGATGNGGAAVKVNTSRLSNGTAQKFFSVEREHADIAQFFTFRGMAVDKMSFDFQSGSIVTGSFDFIGKDSVRATSTTMGTSVASQTFDVMNAVTGVGNILEGGVALSGTSMKSLNISLSNNQGAQDAIGSLGAIGVRNGTVMVEGTVSIYLSDGTLYDKFLNQTATTINWSTVDGAGNGYVFTLGKVKYKDGKVTGGSLNSDCMLELPFTALMDSTGKTIYVDRVGNGV